MDIAAHLSNVAPGPCVKATARDQSPFTVLKFSKTDAVKKMVKLYYYFFTMNKSYVTILQYI